jgi:hypothetical protein
LNIHVFFSDSNECIVHQTTANDLIRLVTSVGFKEISTVELLKKKRAPVEGDWDALTNTQAAVLKAALTAGLYPNVASISYDAPLDNKPRRQVCIGVTAQGQETHVHPASVNRFLGVNGWLLYQEKVGL